MTALVAILPAMAHHGPVSLPVPSRIHSTHGDKENHISGKPASTSFSTVSNVRNRRERPCDACRRRKSRCVIHEGAVLCVLCEFHRQVRWVS